ncbi:MAG: hypothetical protein ACJA2G_001797 [Cognaticolwellia sp.]|jgi:hypothetical protein
MQAAQMKLKVLLPYKVFIEQAQVMCIIAETNFYSSYCSIIFKTG